MRSAERLIVERTRDSVWRIALLLAAWCAFATLAHGADAPEIAVQLGESEVFTGESVDYLVEIRNVKNPSSPDLTALEEDFEVVANGDESRNQSSTYIVNGRISQQNSFSHLYRYRLTPKRNGELTVPAPTATIDGKSYRGRSLRLTVQAPEAQDLVIPEIVVDRLRVYPSQSFEVKLRVFVRPLPDAAQRDPLTPLRRQPPKIEVNWVDLPAGLTGEDKVAWLQKLLADDGVGFQLNDVALRGGLFLEGPRAAVFQLHQGREVRDDLAGSPVRYHLYELKRTITAEKTGVYSLGPAVVKGSFVEGMEGRGYAGKRLVAVAPAVAVEVREVPQPRPATFCGGVGGYRAEVAVSPTTLRVGDPLTLSLEITRATAGGSLDLISAPDLTANPQLAEDFEIVDRNPTGRVAGDSKRFEYALRPRKPNVAITPLTVTFFNPDSESFVDVETSSVDLEVTEANRIGAGDLVGSSGGTSGRDIKSQEQGIYQNITDLRELRDQRVHVTYLASAAAGAWLLAAGAAGWVAAQRRRSGDVVGQRRRGARRAAEMGLSKAQRALADGQPGLALRLGRGALLGLLADYCGLVPDGLTAGDADRVLRDSPVDEVARRETRRLLEVMESAEYGSGDLGQTTEILGALERLLPSLARGLERRGSQCAGQ